MVLAHAVCQVLRCQSPRHLSAGLRLNHSRGGPLACRQADTGKLLSRVGAVHRAACVFSQPSGRLPSETRTQDIRPEAAVHFWTRSWEPRMVISATSYRSHEPALIQHGKFNHTGQEDGRGTVRPSYGPATTDAKSPEIISEVRWPGLFSLSVIFCLFVCLSLCLCLPLSPTLYPFLYHL